MTLTRSFIRNAVTTPLDARLMNMAGLVANSDGSPRVGVLGGANHSIVSTLATMNVAVAAAEFATSKGKADGVAVFTNDGVVNVPIAAAPASNSRITVIWVKHNDNTTGDANSLPVFGTTDGAAAAIPTKPAIPTGALELATLRVYSGTTASNGGPNTLVNTYQMTTARDATVPFRTKVELDAWTNPVDGQEAYVGGESSTYRRVAGAWQLWERPWTNYTPTISGFTLVGGVFSIAKYKVDAGIVTVKIRAAVASMTANPAITLPINASDALTEHLHNTTALIPGAGSEAVGTIRKASATTATFFSLIYSSNNIYINNIGPTVPIAWGATGTIASMFNYDPAA